MFSRLCRIIKQHRNIVYYLFFGVLTTAVNYVVYLPLYNLAHFSATLSNGIAWALSVVFAYLTNKPFVFKSNDWSMKTVVPEFLKFIGCRIGSGTAETLLLHVTVDQMHWNGNLMKLIISILVLVWNYIGSKLLVFRRKEEA